MPTPTDPKLNQNEEDWGILYEPEHGFCYYKKGDKDSELRYCSQGTELKVGKYVLKDPPISWRGIMIKWEAQEITYDQENTGLLYNSINEQLKSILFEGTRGRTDVELKAHFAQEKEKGKKGLSFSSVYTK